MSDVAFFVMRKFLKDNCSLMEHQVDCCRSLISKRRALFVDAVGNGKCKSGDSRLFFNGGYPKLKDLVSGASEGFTDLFGSVYQWDGKSASASSFYKESNCRLYHWLCKSGREFNGTADHKVLALRRGKSVPRLYKMSSLSAGDYLLRPSFMLDIDMSSFDVPLAYRCILYGIYLSRLTNESSSASRVTYYGYKPLLSWIRGVECSLTGASLGMHDFDSEEHGFSFSIPIESSCLGAWVTSTSDGVCEAIFALPAVYRFLFVYGYLVGYDFIYTTIFFASRLSSMVDSLSDLLESLNVTFYHDMDSGPEKGTTYHLVCDRGGSSLFLRYCNLIMPFLHDLPSDVRRPWNNLIGIEEYYQTSNPRGSYSFVRALPSSFVASLRAFNKRFPKGFLPKEVASWLSSIDQTGTMSTRTLNVLISAYTSVGVTPPDALIKLSGCEFDELVSRRETIEAVYDITVPDGHVFVSDGCLNHNTVCCLYSYSYLRSRNSVDLMVVFTPLNAYTKEIWLKDAQKFTNLRCLSIDELKKRVSSGQSVEDVISDVDVLYGKHTHCKTDYALLRDLYLLGTKLRILTVCDETHAFKSPKTELTTTMSLLLRNTYALWGITATILSKNCIDTYHIINFVYPRFFRSIRGFQNQFCRMESKVIGRNPDGSLKKVYTIVDYKDPKALMDYCSSVLVVGSPPVEAHVHMVPYTMSEEESDLYARVANGIMLSGADDEDDTSWLKRALSRDDILSRDVKSVKDLERHSSRFIYLQAVTDGCLNDDGTFGTKGGNKVKALIDLCRDIASRNESALIYADYYTTVDVLLHHLRRSGIKDSNGKDIVVVEQSSRVGLKKNQVTESMCSLRSYFIIMTRSATESANFTFLNNAILFDIPVVPISVIQFVGRITRRSSKFLGDLHAWYFRNGCDISEYKLRLVGFKTYMQERISFEVPNFPREYVKAMTDGEHLKMAKRVLLWHDLKPQKVKHPDAPASPQGTLF